MKALAVQRGFAAGVCLVVALAGCGGGASDMSSSPDRSDPTPARYRPGAPGCRPHQPAGTAGDIGEDIVGSRAADVVACFGPPVRRRAATRGPCLFYRQRGQATYWRFCVRGGRVVSALGNLARPGDP